MQRPGLSVCPMDRRVGLFSGHDTGLLTLLTNSAQTALIRVPCHLQRYKLATNQVTGVHVAQTRGGESVECSDAGMCIEIISSGLLEITFLSGGSVKMCLMERKSRTQHFEQIPQTGLWLWWREIEPKKVYQLQNPNSTETLAKSKLDFCLKAMGRHLL